jgi:DNA-binding XRE family transcriptional regulator
MTPGQCREARQKLNWTQQELAKAADVPLWFICAFEDDDAPESLLHYEIALREALEDVGIGFPFEISGGESRPAGIIYSPPDEDETD